MAVSGSLIYKLILLGDFNVGKSSIFYRFKEDIFREYSNVTLHIENCSKNIEVDGKYITLVLWDTVGTERFRTLTRNYFRNSHVCLLIYSVSDPDSLLGLAQWLQDANNYAESALKVLVGNKCDLPSSVDEQKLTEFAHYHNCDIVFQVSAKTGEGIHELFHIISQKLLEKENKRHINQRLFDNSGDDDIYSLNEKGGVSAFTCCSN
ncbi:GTP-binding protein YPT1-like [Centruroides sculpturatus]|uniref:GTP-binding protein YPT1-like n=1 Tax=Centruroides sculpturatus TaxID=218467 RepID=UPI000C6D744F|nr:GTP-binding protein YPT1-like [Centruroides sculpturatus]